MELKERMKEGKEGCIWVKERMKKDERNDKR